jgi:hypothetical protein
MISILITPDKVRSGKTIGHTVRAYMVGREHPFVTYVSEPNRNNPKFRFMVFNTIHDCETLDQAIDTFADIATPALIMAVQ